MNNSNKVISMIKCEKCNIWMLEISYYRHLNTDKHKMNEVEYKEKLRQHGINAILHGEENEKFILEVLKTLNFEDIIYQGFTANKFDVFIKFGDEHHYRGLQIKTLTCQSDKDYYSIRSNRSGYENDTLLIAVSNDKIKFALIFYNEMAGRKTFSINADRLINDANIFKIMVTEAARKSTIVINFNDYLGKSQKQEAESINRFRRRCEYLNIPFQYNNVNANEIDAIVNGFNVQFKSSTTIGTYIYQFCLCRNTNGVLRPYSIDDNVDFFYLR